MKCSRCGAEIVVNTGSGAAGYGVSRDGEKVCYGCCAEEDRQHMWDNDSITIYLTKDKEGKMWVSNWPGSLNLRALVTAGRHNWAKRRVDAWFVFEGRAWHGVQYGHFSELCYCKKLKAGGRAEEETRHWYHGMLWKNQGGETREG